MEELNNLSVLPDQKRELTFSEYLSLLSGEDTSFPKIPEGEDRKPIGTIYDENYLNTKLTSKNKNGVIDVEKYVDNLMELRREFEDKKMPYPELLEVGQKIKENKLLPRDIYTNPVLMQVVDDHVKARFGPNMIQRLTDLDGGTEFISEVARTVRGFKDYDKMETRKRWEKFQNYMRSWEIGNFQTVVTDLVAGNIATEQEREKIGAGYKLFGLQDNAITGGGTYKEMGDALFDYGRSLAFDVTNALSFGVSKLFTIPVARGSKKMFTESLNKLSKATYKSLLQQGVSPQRARKIVFSKIANRNLASATLKYMLPDMAFNVGIDLMQQFQLINVGNQEEVDRNRLAVVAITGAALPLTVGSGTVAYRKLKNSPIFEKYFLNYEDALETVRLSGKKMSQVIKERVLEDPKPLIDAVDSTFGVIKSGITDLKKWEEAKAEAIEFVRSARNPDYTNLSLFLSRFFHGVKDKDGNLITKGYYEALTDNGWTFSKDALEDGEKATSIVANTITWLDDKVIERAAKAHEEMTGVSLNLKTYTAKELESNYISLASTGGRINQITSVMVKGKKVSDGLINDPVQSLNALLGEKGDEVITPKRMQFGLSIYKRFLTSHPATTGTNLKGFAALNLADSASEFNTSIINIVQSGYYKAIGDKDRAAYFAKQSWANLLSSVKRGAAVLDPDLNIQLAKLILDTDPKVLNELMRDMAGDGGVERGIEIYNLGNSKIAKGLDTSSKFFQAASLMRLQNDYTKLWAFTNNMNRYIMKHYGVSPTAFFRDKNSQVTINTKDFVDNVLMKAAYQTNRQTASVNWTTLNKVEGSNFFRDSAEFIEYVTNKTGLGFVVPFGSFMNTVLATFGDYSGINFLRSAARDWSGKPNDMVTSEMLGKTASGFSYIVYRTLYDFSGNGNSAIEKVSDGRSYKQNYDDKGELLNSEFDWPINQAEMISQALAHAISGDGRDVMKDLQGLNTAETVDYIAKHFNPSNIPPDLIAEIGVSLGASAVRDTEKVMKYFTEKFYNISTNEGDGTLNEFLGMFADGAARVTNGILRPFEPFNVVNNIFNGDGQIPDLRQGNQRYNQAFRYVNSLIDTGVETITGEKPVRPTRYTITQGFDENVSYDEGKILFGARRSPPNTLGHMMLNSIGLPSYKFSRWDGDPIVKNAMDKLAGPIFESIARNTLQRYPNFFRADLKTKKQIVLGKGGMQEQLRNLTIQQLEKYSPEYLDIKYLSTFDKSKLREIKEKLGEVYGMNLIDMDFSEILELKDGVELLSIMKQEAQNYDTFQFGYDQIDKQMGLN